MALRPSDTVRQRPKGISMKLFEALSNPFQVIRFQSIQSPDPLGLVSSHSILHMYARACVCAV